MIQYEPQPDPVLIKAVCDAKGCGKSLKYPHNGNLNYGILRSSFGYGSTLDDAGFEKQICEDCWKKVFEFLGIPIDWWETNAEEKTEDAAPEEAAPAHRQCDESGPASESGTPGSGN